jgi:putative ABC transport system permease protein
MKLTFLLKYMNSKKKFIVLILLQTTIYIYFLMSFFSFTLFKHNYIENYNKYYPVYNGFSLTSKETGLFGNIDKLPGELPKFMSYLDKNKYIENYRLYIDDTSYNQDYFNMDYTKYRSKYNSMDEDTTSIPSIKIDRTYYNVIKKYVNGPGFKASDFHKNNNYTPIIMGKNFSKDYKIGQVIISRDEKIKFQVVGFLKENVLVMGYEPVYNSKSLEGTFILPLDRSKDLLDGGVVANSLQHFSIEFNPNKISYKAASQQTLQEMHSLGMDYSALNFYDSFNGFLIMIGSELKFEIFRTSVLTILSLGALTLSLLYSINTRKKDIGILYALGAKKRDIIFMLFFESILITLLAYLVSVPLYMHFGRQVMLIFLTDYGFENMGYAFIAALLISFISLIIPCYKVIKLNPRDLIGGFRE